MKKSIMTLGLLICLAPFQVWACTAYPVQSFQAYEHIPFQQQTLFVSIKVVCQKPTSFSLGLSGVSNQGITHLQGVRTKIPATVRHAKTQRVVGDLPHGISGHADQYGTVIDLQVKPHIQHLPVADTYHLVFNIVLNY